MAQNQLTIAFVGCGNMGGAVLQGLLDASTLESTPESSAGEGWDFIACTKSERSARTLQESFRQYGSRVQVWASRNVEAMKRADVIVLGCKPYMASDVLGEPGVQEAMGGKLLVSMLAGLSAHDVRKIAVGAKADGHAAGPYIAKAVPNIAARYRQSMTIFESLDVDFPVEQKRLLESIFDQVGRVSYLAPELVNVGSMLMTACMATLSVSLEGLLDGAVIEGLRRPEAMELAVQGISGLAAVLANGTHPAVMREAISSPRGCTIQTLLTVEKASTRAVFAQALIDGTRHLQPSTK